MRASTSAGRPSYRVDGAVPQMQVLRRNTAVVLVLMQAGIAALRRSSSLALDMAKAATGSRRAYHREHHRA